MVSNGLNEYRLDCMNMNVVAKTLCWLSVGAATLSCHDEQVGWKGRLEARLVALDGAGVERTSFHADTDISFALNLVNVSSDTIDAGGYFDYCAVYNVDEFLLVYKRVSSPAQKWEPVAKAYVPPIFCAMVNLRLDIPPHSERSVCGMKWTTNTGNAPLGAGQYYTALSHLLEIDGKVLAVNLRLDFEIR